MLWSLLSSAYIIYLYRKLRSERARQAPATETDTTPGPGAELDELNRRLDALEARLAGTKGQETAR